MNTAAPTTASYAALKACVQFNCDVADARHGTDYSLCTYLMKMREYYRWEKGLPFGAHLPKEDLGYWLSSRERHWQALEEEEFRPLDIDGVDYDPYATEAINQALLDSGLVYSGGLGQQGKPHFFLGTLDRYQRSQEMTIMIAGRELARDLGSPPAMALGNLVLVRRESLRRMLWERLETWRWNRPENALARAFAGYDFEGDLEQALDRMTEDELDLVLWHEIGEQRAGQQLGDDWNQMLLSLSGTPAELMARAVRDHLADSLTTLPALVRTARASSIHFFIGNLGHMRREIFPSLQLAYRDWLQAADASVFNPLIERAREHWASLAHNLLQAYLRSAEMSPQRVKELVEQSHL